MIAEPSWGPDGLVPVIVQDEADGRVLMVAYSDAEALAMTESTALLHFYSRSRQTLWRKGETSGNSLRVVRLELDCDRDAILATVRPSGPTCHRGTRSCFDPEGADVVPWDGPASVTDDPARGGATGPIEPAGQGFAWLETLWSTIEDRAATRPEGSYTASLLAQGVDGVARKVTEEATEVLIAAKDDAATETAGLDRAATRAALAGEVADLAYHALALLAERGLDPAEVLRTLSDRHGGAASA